MKSTAPRGDSKNGRALAYMPQLDGLRAVAITLVTVEHWLYESFLNRALPTGFLGVRLFFVLSGYLITGILLRASSKEAAWGQILRSFYVRRFLRIFPVFYLTLAVLYITDFSTVRELIAWHLSYTCNVFYFLNQGLKGMESHFWTLAAEEQFYIVWPLLIVATPRHSLRRAMLVFVAAGVLSRFALLGMGYQYILTFPLTSFDSFAIGGLLAHAAESSEDQPGRSLWLRCGWFWWLNVAALLGLTLFPWPYDRTHWLYKGLLSLNWSIFFAWLVGHASLGFGGLLGALLANRVVVYLGRISYGFYIFHVFVGVLYDCLGPGAHVSWLATSVDYLAKYASTVVVAALSWHLFESPINSVKKYFEY
jgi:peptidoglycan/LPS O-acetylase OafA/YrhL